MPSACPCSPTSGTTWRRIVRAPTGSNPCKHIAAVYLLLGEEFDRDPFLIFRMRGMDREDLLGPEFRRSAQTLEGPTLPAEPLPPEPGEFWSNLLTAMREKDHAGPVVIPELSAALPQQLGAVPALAGQPRIHPGHAGNLPHNLATGRRPPHWDRRNRLTTQQQSERRNRHGPPPQPLYASTSTAG